MAVYNCARHGRVEIVYLEIGIHGRFPAVVTCPGGTPEHAMVKQDEPILPPNTKVVKADEMS